MSSDITTIASSTDSDPQVPAELSHASTSASDQLSETTEPSNSTLGLKHPIAFTFKLPSFLSSSTSSATTTNTGAAENNPNRLRPETNCADSTLSTPVSSLSSLPSSLSSPSTPHSPPSITASYTPMAVSAPASPTTPSLQQSHIFSPFNRSHASATLVPVAIGTRIRLRSPEHLHMKLQQYAFLEGEIISIPAHPNTWYGIRLFGKGGNKEIKIRNSAFEIVLNDSQINSKEQSGNVNLESHSGIVEYPSHSLKPTQLVDTPPLPAALNVSAMSSSENTPMQIVPVTPTPINAFRNGMPIPANLQVSSNAQLGNTTSTSMSAPATPAHFRSNSMMSSHTSGKPYGSPAISSVPSTPMETRHIIMSDLSLQTSSQPMDACLRMKEVSDSLSTPERTRAKSLEVHINEDSAMTIEAPVPLDSDQNQAMNAASMSSSQPSNANNMTSIGNVVSSKQDSSNNAVIANDVYNQQIVGEGMLAHGIVSQMQSYMNALYQANMEALAAAGVLNPAGDASLNPAVLGMSSSTPSIATSAPQNTLEGLSSQQNLASEIGAQIPLYNIPLNLINQVGVAGMNNMMSGVSMSNPMANMAVSQMIGQMQQMAIMNASTQSPSYLNLNNYNNIQNPPTSNNSNLDMYTFHAISGQLMGYPVDILSGAYSGQTGVIVDLAPDQLLVRVGNENVVKRYTEVGLAVPLTVTSPSANSSVSSSVSASTSPSSNPSPTHAYSLSLASPSNVNTEQTVLNPYNGANPTTTNATFNLAQLQQMGYFYNPNMPLSAESANWFQMMMVANKFADANQSLSASSRRKSGSGKFFGGRERAKSSKIVVGRQVLVASGRMKGEIGVVIKGSNGYFTIKFPKEFDALKESENTIMKRSTDLRLIEPHMIAEDGQFINLPQLSDDDENAEGSSRSTGSTPRSKSAGSTPRSKSSTPRKYRTSSSNKEKVNESYTSEGADENAAKAELIGGPDENVTPEKPASSKSFSKSAPTSPLAATSKGDQGRKKTKTKRSEPIVNESETSTADDEDDANDDRDLKMVDEHGQLSKSQTQADKTSDSSSIEKGQYVRIVLGEGRGEIGRVQYISSENGYLYIDIEENGNQYLKHLNEVVLLTTAEAKKAQRLRNAEKGKDTTKKGKKQQLVASTKKRGKRSRSPSPLSAKSAKQSRVVSTKTSKSPRSTKSSAKSSAASPTVKSTPKAGKKTKNNEEHLNSAASLLMELLTVPDNEGGTTDSQMTDSDPQKTEGVILALKDEERMVEPVASVELVNVS